MAEATVGMLRVVLSSNSAQFDASMDKSGAKVEAFGQSGRRAAASLARLVGDFNGSKITAEATKMAAAIEKVGGVSKLTDSELAKVNRTIDAATAKYRLMGQEVPPQIAKLRSEVAALDRASDAAATGGVTKFSGALGMVSKLLPALGVTSAVAGLARLGTAALESADRYVTLADKLGVSTVAVQRWDYVAGQTGTTVEAFGANAFKLGVNVANGTDKVRKAVESLNLSYAELKDLKPEQQFDVVMKALEGVESATERNAIGQALFGRQFTEMAAAVAAGYTQMKDEAAIASDAQVRAAERAGDAWERLKGKIAAVALGAVGRLAQDFMDVAASVDSLSAAERAEFAVAQRMGDGHTYLIDLQHKRMEAQAALAKVQAHGTRVTAEDAAAQTDYVQKLSAVRSEVAGLTSEKKAQIDAALKLGGVTKELSDEIGVSEDALRMYSAQGKSAAKSTSDIGNEMKKAEEEARRFADSIRSVQIAIKGYVTVPQGVSDSREEIAAIRQEMEAMASIRTMDAVWPPFVAGAKESGDAVAALSLRLRQMADLKGAIGDVFKGIPGTISQALVSGGSLGDAAKSITSQLGSNLAKMGATALGFTGPWGQAIAGAVGALAPMISKLWGGASKEVMAARKASDEFQESLHKTLTATQRLETGGEKWKMTVVAVREAYIATGRTAAEAEAIVKQLWNTDNPKASAAAIAQINDVLREQAEILAANKSQANTLFDKIMAAGADGIPAAYRPAIDQLIALGLLTDEQAEKMRALGDSGKMNIRAMDDALALFKGRAESLGPAYQQAKIDETSMKYINAIELMTKNGGNLDQVLHDAQEELSALVVESRKSGTTLPANMQPWIESLIAQGKLVDENGEKITDISGIKFGEKQKTEAEIAEEGWKNIAEMIQVLIDKIAGPLTNAINNLPSEHRVRIGVDDPDGLLDRDGSHRTQPTGDRDPGFAMGTMGRLGSWFGSFPKAGFATLLHGMEAVLRPQDAVPFALDTLSGLIPDGSALGNTPSLAGVGAGTTNTTKNITHFVMLAMPPDTAGDTYRMTREVIKAVPAALRVNEAEITRGVEQVIKDYIRTYPRG